MLRNFLPPTVLLALLPAALLALFLAVPAVAEDAVVDAHVPWIRSGALYAEGRGELRWGEMRDRATGTTLRTRCVEAQRGIELDCPSLAMVGFILRARLTVTPDGFVRRIDVIEMRQ